MAKELTWRKAIEKVLGSTDGAMHYKDIAEKIVGEGLRKNVGATPSATVSASLATSIASDGVKNHRFRRSVKVSTFFARRLLQNRQNLKIWSKLIS
jgi:hypothetical protein